MQHKSLRRDYVNGIVGAFYNSQRNGSHLWGGCLGSETSMAVVWRWPNLTGCLMHGTGNSRTLRFHADTQARRRFAQRIGPN